MSLASVDHFDESRRWCVSSQVSLRDEAFGALAYHHHSRRLVFLKSRELVELLRRLEEFDSAAQALNELVEPHEREQYWRALGSLARSELIREC